MSTKIPHIGTKIISIGIAVMLWAIILGSRPIEDEKEIALQINTPPGLVVASDAPKFVIFRLSGPKALVRAIQDRRDPPIKIDLSKENPGKHIKRISADSLRIPLGVKNLGAIPNEVTISLERMRTKRVPLELNLQGALPSGFALTQKVLDPDYVRIQGSESEIERIQSLRTMPIDLNEVRGEYQSEIPVQLEDYSTVQLQGENPKIKLVVESLQANFRIKNVKLQVLADLPYRLALDPPKISILVKADPKLLKDLNRSQVYGWIDLRGKPKGSFEQTVQVQLPPGIFLVQTVPDRVRGTLQ